MEYSKAKLPPIFKFSMIWNILPYYGYLSDWEKLLVKLSSATKLIWEEHWKAFRILGRDFMRDLYTDGENIDLQRILFDVFKVYFRYSTSDGKSKEIQKTKNGIQELIKILGRNEVIILDSFYVEYQIARVMFLQNDEIEDVVPSITCPVYKPNIKSFRLGSISNAFIKYIFSRVKKMPVIIKINRKKIEVHSCIGKWYDILCNEKPASFKVHKEVDRILASCPQHEWVWKPTKLIIYGHWAKIANKIECFQYMSNIKEFKINLLAFWEDYDLFWMLISKYKHISFNVNVYAGSRCIWGIEAKFYEKI